MGDVAKGIRSFRKGLNEPDDERAITDRRDNGAGKDTPSEH
jgi:Sec-independent protein translocase protein TatA